MDSFVRQSLDSSTTAITNTKQVPVKKALFRVADTIPREGQESFLKDNVFDTIGEDHFDYQGQLLATDGGRSTKLTKLFKRRDNKGKLFGELQRMKIHQ
mmetsp:Transcript_17942/g.25853  ORF Transcript_17942/g.25853 Transcript_17942/m.25853 type:complete len:99 (-) Transcript_17942:65-361(-)